MQIDLRAALVGCYELFVGIRAGLGELVSGCRDLLRPAAKLRAVPATPQRETASVFHRMTRVAVVAALLAGVLLAVAMVAAPAKAFDFACAVGGGNAANIGPEGADVGSAIWVPDVPSEDVDPSEAGTARGHQKDPNAHTLWEVAGSRGLLWSFAPTIPKSDAKSDNFDRENSENNFEDACSPVDASAGYVAQLMFEPSRFIGGLTIGLKQVATTTAPFKAFYAEQSDLLDVLHRTLFQPALVLAVIATGVWTMTRVQRQDDQRETYGGLIWSAVIVVGVSAVLIGDNQQSLTKYVDQQTSTFHEQALNVTAGVTDDGEQQGNGPCYIWERDAYNKGARNSSCMLYEMLLYNPWSLGQFGTTNPVLVDDLCYDRGEIEAIQCDPNGSSAEDGCIFSPYRCAAADRPAQDGEKTRINLAVQQVIAQAETRNETLDDAREDPDPDGEYSTYERHWRNVQFAVGDQHDNKYMMWKGSEPTSRMATAVSTGLMNLIMLLAVGFIALLTIFWHGVMFVAWILLPVVGAVAAFPPARRIFAAYLGIMVQAVFLRAVFGLVLVLLLSIMNAINLSSGNTGLKIILMIIAAAAMWKLLSALRSGQASPTIIRAAGDQGVLPNDGIADRATGYARRRWEQYRNATRADRHSRRRRTESRVQVDPSTPRGPERKHAPPEQHRTRSAKGTGISRRAPQGQPTSEDADTPQQPPSPNADPGRTTSAPDE